MRALVVAPQPFFSPRGTPFSVYYRTLITAELGVEVDLLTYGQGQDVDIPGVRIHRVPRFAALGPVPVGPSLLKLWLDLFLVAWTVALLLRRRYDFVHAHEESVFFLRYLKPLFRFKLVYDMHSSLPQQLTNFQFTRSRLLIGMFRALENTCLARAEAVITVCPALRDYARPLVPDPRRLFLLENTLFEPVRLRGGDGRPTPQAPPIALPSGRPLVLYAGTFESYQGLDLLLRAFAEVRQRRPDAFLLLVGGRAEQVARYRGLAVELGLADDTAFTGTLAPDAARSFLGRASVLTSPRIEGTNTPLKIYEQLASGVPLVATRIAAHTQVLDDEVCFLVEPEASAMARGILAALDDGARRCAVVANARRLYDERYSRDAYVAKLREVLRTVA